MDIIDDLRVSNVEINLMLYNLIEKLGLFINIADISTNLLKTILIIPCDISTSIAIDIKNEIFGHPGPPVEITINNRGIEYNIPVRDPSNFNYDLLLSKLSS